MTGALCAAYCANKGFIYAGTEYADECYCGNKLSAPTSLQNDTQCSMSCAGNSTEACGGKIPAQKPMMRSADVLSTGPNYLTVYFANKDAPKGPSINPGPSNWTSYGCWTDGNTRTLRKVMQMPGGFSNGTVAGCTSVCGAGGYTLAGFNGWYDQGCYTDSVNARTLRYGQAVPGGPQNMTVENCVASCKKAGYTIAGVEYSGECFCDNTVSNGGGPAPDGSAQCNMQCSGNQDETCGGPNRLNVYAFNSKGLPTATRTSTTASATATTSSGGDDTPTQTTPTAKPTSGVNATAILPFKYQGCYTDNMQAGRALINQRPDNQSMTVESCIAACSSQGYAIAGMEYSAQCFCDNYLRNSPTLRDDTECNMACAGNGGQKCGDGGRLSVYSNGTLANYTSPGFLTDNLPRNWSFAGCLEDNVNNQRSLPYQMEFPKDNSNVKCMKLCQEFGYTAAGTEYGEQCFCGDPQNYIDAGARMIANSSCNMRCANDTAGSNGGELCGGGNAISLYTWTANPPNQWTIATGNAAGAYEFLIGGVTIPLVTAPARNGKVTFVEKFGTSTNASSTGAYELDLAFINDFSKAWREMHVKTDVFCSASLTLPDRAGRQINIGGWSHPSTEGVRLYWPDGSPGVPGKNDWEENFEEIALLAGRWYPSAMIMSNGSVLVMGGEEGSNGAPVPSLELLPATGNLQECDYLRRTDPNNLYPFLINLPSGNIFVGYYNEALLLDPVSLQPVKQLPNMPGSVNRPDSGRTYPFEGTAVVMPQHAPFSDPLEVLICGGSNPGVAVALDNCITITPDVPGANWTIERMPSKRVLTMMTALPDGTFLISGGAHQGTAGFGLATDPNLNAVLYDPSKPVGKRMTVMANTTVARLYHSEAVLLDDGRVLISGSDPEDNANPQEYRNEVFIPPYLMGNPSRPEFNTTDLDWSYGSSHTLSILQPGAGGNFKVSLMGAVASTHGNSMGQRTYFLSASCSGSSCTVTAPPDGNTCPPGWFQLFLLDGAGVPSHAIWVRVGGDPGRLGNWPDAKGFSLPGMGAVERLF
ncbi:uncharacterized protein MYCFIDRAFT_165158 [Pseudocercospora fijiensis CIRAD86]|uniref:WSC domain-containing protein n=1 Tax=Pseudocercospora fijiensis (strain CIRAD86) TaxID=383855 RepID=M3ABK3_PSEFD|nr:uncharacterized protein MYCFIDRAFT_165158 [Pseudocercospora fijiensis CIRAD86]EME81961.1 hypothetical protein MYCFIDRAFT_165158 [Pseudocercospora fijiensis CIRAD86]